MESSATTVIGGLVTARFVESTTYRISVSRIQSANISTFALPGTRPVSRDSRGNYFKTSQSLEADSFTDEHTSM